MTGWGAVAAYSLAWAACGLVTGVVGAALPPAALARDRGPLRLVAGERDGRWYERRLGVKRWKDRLPEAGGWFRSEGSKSSLHGHGVADVERLARETRRAEWVHWANVAFGPTFFLWSSWPIGAVMTAFGVVVHSPFIAVQRYNRARAGRVLRRAASQERTAAASVDHADPEPGDARAGRRRRRRRRLAVATLASLAAGAIAYAIWRPAPLREVTLAEAVRRFEAQQPEATSERSGDQRPAAGVYLYRGTGTESLDRPPVSQAQGPDMPATVTHRGDRCWSFRIDYSSKHQQTWDFCNDGGDVVEEGGSTLQYLNLIVTDVEISSSTTCDPATRAVVEGAAPGDAEDQRCEALSTGAETPVTSSGPNRFVGPEPLRIGGDDVETVHYRRERTISGDQDGTEDLDLWFDRDTGLPVRNEREITLRTGSPLGVLTYTEVGSFELVSTPAG